jgi:general secretion pathway protein C
MSPRAPHLAGQLFTIGMVILLGLQLAWWGWHFMGPRATQATTAPDAALSTSGEGLSRARQLFGEAAESGVATGSSASAPTPAGDIRLKGVFAVDGKTLSAAIVNNGGRDLSVRVGEAITDSVKLAEVHPDHVVITRAGVREKIPLERLANILASAGAAGSPQAGTSASGFRLRVAMSGQNNFSLSRTELNNVLKDPNQINHLGTIAPSSGGVQVKDAPPGSLMQKLGLLPGDIITSLNGQPVAGPGDLARLYGQFGQTSNVRAEVKRGGVPLTISYAINP